MIQATRPVSAAARRFFGGTQSPPPAQLSEVPASDRSAHGPRERPYFSPVRLNSRQMGRHNTTLSDIAPGAGWTQCRIKSVMSRRRGYPPQADGALAQAFGWARRINSTSAFFAEYFVSFLQVFSLRILPCLSLFDSA